MRPTRIKTSCGQAFNTDGLIPVFTGCLDVGLDITLERVWMVPRKRVLLAEYLDQGTTRHERLTGDDMRRTLKLLDLEELAELCENPI